MTSSDTGPGQPASADTSLPPGKSKGTESPGGVTPPSGTSGDPATLPVANPDLLVTAFMHAGPGPESEIATDVLCNRRVAYLGDYELLEEIARGGMGIVYRARQLSLNRVVALKMILAGQFAGPEDVTRFRMEAESAANLNHPGIVPIYEVGQHEGHHYFSMGFIDGESLQQKVTRGPLPPREAAAITRTVAAAIAYSHAKGVIHRDLKPANILQDRQGDVKVTDFGLARRLQNESGLTRSGARMGTPSYMSPEQAAGKIQQVGPLSDVYSLGAVLYCLLTGRPPFQSSSALDTMVQVVEREPVPLRQLDSAIDRDLETICLKCLAKVPAERYASAADLEADLSRYLSDQPIHARPPGLWERAQQWSRNHVVTVTTLLLFLGSSVIVLPLLGPAIGQFLNRPASEISREGGALTGFGGNVAQASRVLREMNRRLARDPDDLAVLGERARALVATGETAAAQKDLNTLIERQGDQSEWRLLRAELAQRSGRFRDAIGDLTAVLEQEPNRWEIRHQRARARLEQSDLPGALDDVQGALRLRPGLSELYELRADIQDRLGDVAAAQGDRKAARALRDD